MLVRNALLLHTGLNMANACWAFIFLALMPLPVGPNVLTTLQSQVGEVLDVFYFSVVDLNAVCLVGIYSHYFSFLGIDVEASPFHCCFKAGGLILRVLQTMR